jgi:hypothetical protein
VARRQGRELVGTAAANKGRIPAFRSDQEERVTSGGPGSGSHKR